MILRFIWNRMTINVYCFSQSFRNRSTEPMPSEYGYLPVSDDFPTRQPRYVAMPKQNHSMCGKVQSSFQQCGNGTSNEIGRAHV